MAVPATIRIFLDAHTFDGEFQGSRTFIKELYNLLSKKEDIELYIAAHDIENLKQYFPATNNIVFVKLRHRSSILRLLVDIPAALKKYQVQYAHFQYIVPLVKNCRFIVTTHDVLFNEYPKEFSLWYRLSKNWLYKFAAKKADVLTTDSAYSNQSIQKYLGIPAKKINVLRLGINPVFFKPYNKQEAKNYIQLKYGFNKYLLFVSRREPRKNHTLLLRAYLRLKLYEQDYRLVFIGHESIKTASFDAMYEALSPTIKSFIVFINKSADEELLAFYKGASVFIYPSKAEGFGLPPLEAGALKIPVLCSNTSSLSDFSFFGKNHIDPYDYDAFKNKLRDTITQQPDEAFLNTIATTIQKNFCWHNTTEQFYHLIKANAASL
jgi:glycosyltransferase involved in cell wall biosynthesis